MKKLTSALIVSLALGLGGCTSVLTGGDADVYDLNAVSQFGGPLKRANVQLLVEEPIAKRALDTDRMPVRPTRQEYQYLAGARFADRVPSLVQSLLVESIENSGAVRTVARTALGVGGDYVLKGEIRSFDAAFYEDEEHPVVTVRMAVVLVKLGGLQVIGGKSFEASARSDGNETSQIVATYDMAAQMMIKDIVRWSVDQLATQTAKPR